jgi:hypothetical protein
LPKTIKPISPEGARRHEALYLRLAALTRQTEASAIKRPDAPVGATLRRLAEDLLFEARRFIGGPRAIPAAAPDLAGLATQLGQALAALEAYEIGRSHWDPAIKAFVWTTDDPAPLPVKRLRQQAGSPRASAAQSAEQRDIQRKLMRRINAITKGLPDTVEDADEETFGEAAE